MWRRSEGGRKGPPYRSCGGRGGRGGPGGVQGGRQARRRPFPAAAGVVLALFLAAAVSCRAPTRDQGLHGSPLPEPIPAPALELEDTEGRPLDLRQATRGGVTLVFFGYTHCPDVCPVHMATLAGAYGQLEPEVRDQVRILFVTTDPERDTPERLRAWLDGHHRDFVGARAPLAEINRALAELLLPGVAVLPSEHGADGAPLVGHPSAVVAFGADGRARLRYPFGTRRAHWLHDLPRLVGGG